MFVGYARVSTVDQALTPQRDALSAVGCAEIFTDVGASGSVVARNGLDRALAALTKGDTLVVWKLDRLGGSLSQLITLIDGMGQRGVNFRSLSDSIDTSSVDGRHVLHTMGALARFERSLIAEHMQTGMWRAKRCGVSLGRPNVLAPAQIERARFLINSGVSPRAVAQSLHVGKSTLYRALKADSYSQDASHG